MNKEDKQQLANIFSDWLVSVIGVDLSIVDAVAIRNDFSDIAKVMRVVQCIDPNVYPGMRFEADEILKKMIDYGQK